MVRSIAVGDFRAPVIDDKDNDFFKALNVG